MEEMWRRQLSFTRNFIEEGATPKEAREYLKQMAIQMMSEIVELLDASGDWKIHVKEGATVQRSRILEECIDLWKYLLNMLLAYGFTPEEFTQEFHRKSTVVEQKYFQEKLLDTIKYDDKVAVLDIDGVLATWPEDWINYLSEKTGVPLLFDETTNIYYLAPTIPRNDYYRIQHEYYESGKGWSNFKVVPGAPEFCTQIKKKGYKIVILTRRPYKQYPRVFADTLEWLRNNGIIFDALFWAGDKAYTIAQKIPNVAFVLDDEPKQAEDIARLGIKVILFPRPYNKESSLPRMTFGEILEMLKWSRAT